jgi:hypothetical protein
VFAAATIMGTHKFFLGDEWKGDNERVLFYVVMTVLVGAFAVTLVANAPEPDDDDAMLSSRPAEFAHAFPRGSRLSMGRAANRMGGLLCVPAAMSTRDHGILQTAIANRSITN